MSAWRPQRDQAGLHPERRRGGVPLEIVVPRLKQGSDFALRQFLVELAPEHAWKYEQQWAGWVPTSLELLAAKALSFMSLCPVKEKGVTLIELDPADPLLLPVAFHGERTDDTPKLPSDCFLDILPALNSRGFAASAEIKTTPAPVPVMSPSRCVSSSPRPGTRSVTSYTTLLKVEHGKGS